MGRKAKRSYADRGHWVDDDSDSDSGCSGIDWFAEETELTNRLQKIFDEHKSYDMRFSWVGLSDIIKEPDWVIKEISLINPEESKNLAYHLYDELKRFKEKFEVQMDLDLESMKDIDKNDPKFYHLVNLKSLKKTFFEYDMSLGMIYHKICHTICKYYIQQDLNCSGRNHIST